MQVNESIEANLELSYFSCFNMRSFISIEFDFNSMRLLRSSFKSCCLASNSIFKFFNCSAYYPYYSLNVYWNSLKSTFSFIVFNRRLISIEKSSPLLLLKSCTSDLTPLTTCNISTRYASNFILISYKISYTPFYHSTFILLMASFYNYYSSLTLPTSSSNFIDYYWLWRSLSNVRRANSELLMPFSIY